MFQSLVYRMRSAFHDCRGSVAVISAITLPLLVLLLFSAIDMGRSYLVKMKTQEAMDAALVAAIASKDTLEFEEEFAQVFRANIRANYAGAKLIDVEIRDTSNAEDAANNVTVYNGSARVSVPVSYLGIADGSPIEFSVVSQVKLGTNTDRFLELALVLDNSGSMGGGKIESLKTAATSLVNIIFGKQSQSDNINMSVIPYDVVVRIGTGREGWIQPTSLSRYNAQPPGFASNRRSSMMCANEVVVPAQQYDSWRYTPSCSSCLANERCYEPTGNCTTYPPNPDQTCSSCTGNQETGVTCTTYACPFAGYTYCDTTAYCIARAQWPSWSYWYSWGTPVGSTDYCSNNNLIDADDTPPTAGDNWRFRLPYAEAGALAPWSIYWVPSEQYSYLSSLAPMLFSSDTKSEVLSAINAMQISGGTRIHVGLMWGWFTLSPKWQGLWDATRPDLPKTPDPEHLDKALVLMTDGKNYFNENAVTLEVCEAIKASGITIYTVGFGNRADIDEALLKSCASQDTNYFYAPDADALDDSFRQIGGAILYPTIRLTK